MAKARKKKRGPISPNGLSVVAIRWNDAFKIDREELPDNYDSPTFTVGVILEETDEVLVICHEITNPDDSDNETKYDASAIPKSLITWRQGLGTIVEPEDAGTS